MITHTHKFGIADDEAVRVLVEKLTVAGAHQRRRERLREAFEKASQRYNNSNENERRAFFHGLLTGYGVALKLW
jgi:hypothetical protein